MLSRAMVHTSPARIILGSILFTILIGTLILFLPMCRVVPISMLDLLFTATSATCVTGLLPIPLTSFSPIGHCIILILIQIGGLGLITLTLFLISFFIEFGFATQLMAGQLLELESWKNIKKIITFIIALTACIEIIGAIGTFLVIHSDYSFVKACFLSVFHSVSAFCDAGFSLFPEGMITYKNNFFMLSLTGILMIIGGLGFITWHEIIQYVRSLNSHKRFNFSLHSKIVLLTTLLLIASATILFWTLERHNTLAELQPFEILSNALFNAISCRSTGFTTVHTYQLQLATLLMIMIIAFIGSSPGSTGSGIKTTTFAIFTATIIAAITGRNIVSIKGRSIARDQVYKALAIISLSLAWIIIITFCLLITEKGWEFSDILFETVSAFATLGLSTGLTPSLTFTGKILIIATMITGRIGAFAVVLALRKKPELTEFSYPEERIMM